MIVKACTRAEGELLYEALSQGLEYEPNFYEVGSGSRAEGEAVISSLRAVVVELLNDCKEDPGIADKLRFDGIAAESFHRVLPLPDEISGDDSFWRYLALSEMWSIAEWRHGRDGEQPPAEIHFGFGEKWWCLPRRLWLRAELSSIPDAEDPYELTRRGGSDFWMSGIHKHVYAGARPVARALVRFQYPELGEFTGSEYRPQTLTTNGIRELYKRLRHFNAFVGFGALDEPAAAALIASLAGDLPRGR